MIDLPVLGDERGSLVAIEPGDLLPFPIGGVSYLFAGNSDAGKALCAYRSSRTWVIAVSGSCTMLVDDGSERAELRLERADRALEVGAMVWPEARDLSPDAVLMLLAEDSTPGGQAIRTYDAFQAALGTN